MLGVLECFLENMNWGFCAELGQCLGGGGVPDGWLSPHARLGLSCWWGQGPTDASLGSERGQDGRAVAVGALCVPCAGVGLERGQHRFSTVLLVGPCSSPCRQLLKGFELKGTSYQIFWRD